MKKSRLEELVEIGIFRIMCEILTVKQGWKMQEFNVSVVMMRSVKTDHIS